VNIIVLRNSYLAGPSTARAQAVAPHLQMNFLMRLSLGLEIQIHGLGRRGRRGKDLRSSSLIVEPYWFWTGWSRSKTRLVHKKDAYVCLLSKPFCGSLQLLTRGLCVITTRTPVVELADHERTSALRRDLEQLSNDAGAKLLRALGVKGHEVELRNASDEFRGHCLALTLLGSYLTDAFNGDICFRKEVSRYLVHDVRQGAHARTVMESYQTWFGEGPELSVLRMLGLFDRPADEKALGALLKSPAISGLTESLTDLRTTEWRTILARLRRARLLAPEDPRNSGHLDTHPLIREYFGEQLQSQKTDAWKECNRRLYDYYRTLAPQLPNSLREMESLFSTVICACNAGLFREALHEVYIPRIQRGNACFAANVLGAREALLLALARFFEHGCWGPVVETVVERQRLTAEDQLFVLMQAGLYLTATRGFASAEARICYERAEPLCHSLDRPRLLNVALMGRWRYSLVTEKMTATMQIAEQIYSLALKQNDPAAMIAGCSALAPTLCLLGDFDTAWQYAMRGVEIWRSGGVQLVEEIMLSPIVCLAFKAMCEWYLGETSSYQTTKAESISLAKKRNDANALALALYFASLTASLERNPAEVERFASELIELSTRSNFAFWLPGANVLRGWARSVSGATVEGISRIEQGIEDYRTIGNRGTPTWLALKAEACI
jgi:hypothetical protein